MSHFDEMARVWDENPQAVERAKAVAAAIRKAIPLDPSWSALEYGCGTGLLSFELKDTLGPVILADSSSGMLQVSAEKIAALGAEDMQVRDLDLTRDPLPSERFDLIYSMMTLHHIKELPPALESFHALLKPGGYLAIADLDAEDGSFHPAGMDVHHGFERNALRTQLEQAGFQDIRFCDAFEMQREQRTYSVFLCVGRAD